MRNSTRISAMLVSTVAVATLCTAPVKADVAGHAPDSCEPASANAHRDFIDAITFRKEQLSRDRAAFGR